MSLRNVAINGAAYVVFWCALGVAWVQYGIDRVRGRA